MPAHFHKHTMLGAGGKMKIPRSESSVLMRAVQRLSGIEQGVSGLERDVLREVIRDLEALEEQAAEGFHRNAPPFGKGFQAGQVIGQIGDDVNDIRYRHVTDRKWYEHQFNGDVLVFAVERNGKRDLLLTHKSGKSLWEEF
jgi:hypothetical protein